MIRANFSEDFFLIVMGTAKAICPMDLIFDCRLINLNNEKSMAKVQASSWKWMVTRVTS